MNMHRAQKVEASEKALSVICIASFYGVSVCFVSVGLKCRAAFFKSTLHHTLAWYEGLGGHAVLASCEAGDGVHSLACCDLGSSVAAVLDVRPPTSVTWRFLPKPSV